MFNGYYFTFTFTENIPRAIAKPDVVRSRQAVRVRGVEAGWPAGIHGACSTTHTVDALATVGHRRIKSLARDEALGRIDTRDWVADEGEVCVGRLEPIDHLLLGQDVDVGLCRAISEPVVRFMEKYIQLAPR